LIDSGSSHSFDSQSFLQQAAITAEPVSAIHVRVANGEMLVFNSKVMALEWWAQGYTFNTNMRVIELGAYDAILGYNWLRVQNPMVCHWELKTLDF
jgi:hypothetical protein